MTRIVPNCGAFRKPKLIQLVVHRDDGKRFVVRAEERLTAFLELDRRFALAGIVLDDQVRFFQTQRR